MADLNKYYLIYDMLAGVVMVEFYAQHLDAALHYADKQGVEDTDGRVIFPFIEEAE